MMNTISSNLIHYIDINTNTYYIKDITKDVIIFSISLKDENNVLVQTPSQYITTSIYDLKIK